MTNEFIAAICFFSCIVNAGILYALAVWTKRLFLLEKELATYAQEVKVRERNVDEYKKMIEDLAGELYKLEGTISQMQKALILIADKGWKREPG